MKYISRLTALLLAVMLGLSSASALTIDDLTRGTMDALYQAVSEEQYRYCDAGVLGDWIELDAFQNVADKRYYTFQWYDQDGNMLDAADDPCKLRVCNTMTEQQFYCIATDATDNQLKSDIFVIPAAQTTDMEAYLSYLYGNEFYGADGRDLLLTYTQVMNTWNVTLEDGSNLGENVVAAWWAERSLDIFDPELFCFCVVSGKVAADGCVLHPDAVHDVDCEWNNAIVTSGEKSTLSIEVPENAFAVAYEMFAGPVTDAATLEAVDAALLAAAVDEDGNVLTRLDAYDISFEDMDANKLQPAKEVPVKLTFSVPTEAIATTHADGSVTWPEILGVFHLVDNGAGSYTASLVGYTETVDPNEDEQIISVEATEFSIYVVGAIGSTQGTPADSKLTMKVGETVILYSDYKHNGDEDYKYRWSWNEANNNFEISEDDRHVTIKAVNAGTITLTFQYSKNGKNWSAGDTVEIEAVSLVVITFKPNKGEGSDYTIETYTGAFVFPQLAATGMTPPAGAQFGGWGTQSGNGGETYAAGIEQKKLDTRTYYAQWFYPGTGSIGNGWHEVYFFVRIDGEIQAEPASYGNADYYPGGTHAEYNKGYIYTAIEINNNLAAVKANIAEEPTPDDIRKMGVTDFDENTQEVVWYVIKQQDPWHVDGVIRDKAKFEVAYYPNGGDTNYPGSNQYAVGSTVTVNYQKVPSRVGYIFRGWDENPDADSPTYDYDSKSPASFTMPPNNVDLYAIWRPSDATKYTVEHYLCDVNGDNPQLASDATQTMYGTTDQKVTAGYLTTFAGYEPYFGHTNEKREGIIAADGSLVLKLYYRLTCSTLTIKKQGMSTEDGESAIFEVKAYTKAKGDTAQETFIVVVPNGGSAVIGDLLIGKEYTVTEITDWTWRYTSADPVTGTIAATGSSVIFQNNKQNDKWLSDESSVTNNMGSGYRSGYNNE